jgi:ribulose-bisphosphate carboxylase large chain
MGSTSSLVEPRAPIEQEPARSAPAAAVRVVYRVRCEATEAEARARTIAIEQSVETPLEAIDDDFVRTQIMGRVEEIVDRGDGTFGIGLLLSADTIGAEPGQLLNMLFGNTSIHDDVTLEDFAAPADLLTRFGGPNVGLDGLRARVGAGRRALTCSALKPQGLPPAGLAELAGKLAFGGLDYIKDDHGLADQAFSPFAERVAAVAAAVAQANDATGRRCHYVPSLSGSLDDMRRQIAIAREQDIDTVLIAPMIAGVANFHALARANPDIAFIAHPALAGASRIAPALHFGKIFRLLGGDGVIFPNYGGRFGYSAETCRAIATTATAEWAGLRPAAPVPAGGMTLDRAPEMLSSYGVDVMLLIGGGLLSARDRITTVTEAFVKAVEDFRHDG